VVRAVVGGLMLEQAELVIRLTQVLLKVLMAEMGRYTIPEVEAVVVAEDQTLEAQMLLLAQVEVQEPVALEH
jgi:hypothetical protein